MCGIAGVYSLSLDKTERTMFFNLMLLNYFRGEDSTGILRIEDDQVNMHKSLMSSPEFLHTEVGERLIFDDRFEDGSKPIGFIGHCRAATKGKISLDNAHPFEFKNVIGVHNGTIHGGFKGSRDFNTDSEAIFKLINDTSIEEALKHINIPEAAYALVWYDERDSTLNFLRNSKRPLYMTFVYGRTSLIWSSEKMDIQRVLRKAGLSFVSGVTATVTNSSDAIFQLKPHQHMKVKLGAPARDFTFTDLEVQEAQSPTTSGGTTVTAYTKGSSSIATVRGPDGTYRTPSEHFDFMQGWNKKQAAKVIDLRKKQGQPVYEGHHQKDKSKLRELAWLEQPVNKNKGQKADINLGAGPRTPKELEFKLGGGCFCCGTILEYDAYVQSDVVGEPLAIWYTRDYYACRSCYDTSPGDWLKYALEELQTSATSVVSVH